MASARVADVIARGKPSAFMHGPTYMANPIACAAACASLDLFASSDYAAKTTTIDKAFKKYLAGVERLGNVAGVRVLGAAAVIELKGMPSREAIDDVIDAHGVWLRPFANFAYAMPPLVSDVGAVKRICDALADLASREPTPVEDDGGFHE